MRLFSRYRVWQAVVDGGLVAAAWYLAFWLRFDNGIPVWYERLFEQTIYIVVPIMLAVFVCFGFYSHWWRYVSIRDMWAVVRGVTVAAIVAGVAIYLIDPVPGWRVPRSVIVLDWLILLGLVTGARLLARTIFERPGPRALVARGREALIVGAGDAGKGFAVVANEVKELARQTARATEDISRRIETIQHDTQGAVGAIAEITAVIHQINDISNTIASAVEEQSVTTSEITRNVMEAAKASSEIAESITGAAQAAQNTSACANDTQTAAGELARMAADLQALVGRFRCVAEPARPRGPVADERGRATPETALRLAG